jgi:hypothetical protein
MPCFATEFARIFKAHLGKSRTGISVLRDGAGGWEAGHNHNLCIEHVLSEIIALPSRLPTEGSTAFLKGLLLLHILRTAALAQCFDNDNMMIVVHCAALRLTNYRSKKSVESPVINRGYVFNDLN